MDLLPPAFLNGLWIRIFKWLPGCRSHYWYPWRHSRRLHPRSQPPDPHALALRPFCLFGRLGRPVAVGVLVCFSWLTLEPWQYIPLVRSWGKQPVAQAAAPAPEAQLAQFLKNLEEVGRRLDEKVAKGQDSTQEANWFGQAISTLASLHGQMQGRFQEIEQQIATLPAEIHLRHQQAVLKYEQSIPQVQQALNDLVKEATPSGKATKARALADLLQQINPQPQPIPLDPNNLPVRSPEATPIPPRLTPAEYALTEGVKLASANPEGILLAQAATGPPTPADLAETIEVQFTPEIQAKAQELGHNPVKIYNWVRNTIEFVPTYGSIQGAQMCLLTKQCNAFDTASLLIALLRVSGIHARYEYGTIEVPIEKVMNWVGGFTDPNAALQMIAAGGIPVRGVVSGGKIVAAKMEQVWVKTWVDYVPSRGARHKTGQGDTWIPLDASFKQHDYIPGINLQATVPFDIEGFVNQVKSAATIDEQEGFVAKMDATFIRTTLTDYQTRLENYFKTNLPNVRVADLIGSKVIQAQEFSYLLGTLPYRTVVRGGTLSSLSDSLRHKVTFEVTTQVFIGADLTFTASLPELAGKRITLSYVPATAADQRTVDSYGGLYNTPPYLIQVKPQLKVEGIVKAEGTPVGMGVSQSFAMIFSLPNRGSDRVQNNIPSGGYYAIGLVPDRLPESFVSELIRRANTLNTFISTGGDKMADAGLGEQFYLSAMTYFWELDRQADGIAASLNVAHTKQPGEGIFALNLNVSTLFGMPWSAKVKGVTIDVDRDISVAVSKGGDDDARRNFMRVKPIPIVKTKNRVAFGVKRPALVLFLNLPSAFLR